MEGRLGILIVEDDLIQSMMLEKVLESLNHIVLSSTMLGEKAVDLAVEYKPDVIFLDVSLAGRMNGLETALKINQVSDAAIFFVTGNSRVKDSPSLKKTKFKKILLKPISMVDVQVALSKYSISK
jgi:CheY-like chemotaxis protein